MTRPSVRVVRRHRLRRKDAGLGQCAGMSLDACGLESSSVVPEAPGLKKTAEH
jgi:hypothetical protein